MTSRLVALAAACLSAVALAGAPVRAQEAPPIIAVAASVQFAMAEIAEAFTADTGMKVEVSFGSSGNFSRQIREGAPFQMFMAADESYVLDLAKDGFARDEGTIYAQGRLVLIAPHGSSLPVDEDLNGLAAALSDGRITRFAIANPEHAPYGVRAREALQHRGLWQALKPVLVMGENVSQAAQFATTGNAEGGIIGYSLALSDQVSSRGSYALIPGDWHSPLNQRMVLLNDAGPVAEAFYAYIATPETRTIMERYGFVLPGE